MLIKGNYGRIVEGNEKQRYCGRSGLRHCLQNLKDFSCRQLTLSTYLGEGNGNPLQFSSPGDPMERGAWQATVHVVTKESDMT